MERVALRLKELCDLGSISNSEIAEILNKEFGLSLSINSVIGRRQRGRLPAMPRPKCQPEPRRTESRHVRHLVPFVRHPARAPKHRAIPLPTDFPHACALLDLTNEACRYPCGEDSVLFCGLPEADLAGGRPYCAAHMWVSHWH